MKILIIGGTGKQLIKQALNFSRNVTMLARTPDK